MNKEGENVLKQIIRFASKREGITHTVYAARAWARLSCCVQFAAAQQILNRDFVDLTQVAHFLNQIIRFASKELPTLFLLLEPGLASLVVFNILPLSRF